MSVTDDVTWWCGAIDHLAVLTVQLRVPVQVLSHSFIRKERFVKCEMLSRILNYWQIDDLIIGPFLHFPQQCIKKTRVLKRNEVLKYKFYISCTHSTRIFSELYDL